MKLAAKIQYRKNIPTTAAGCVSDPHGGAAQDNTPGLSFEGIGRELRWNNCNSNSTAVGTQGSDDGLSLADMLAGEEFTPNETIKTYYGPYYPAPGSNAASDFLGYDHYDPPPPPPLPPDIGEVGGNAEFANPEPEPPPPPVYDGYNPLAGMVWEGVDWGNFFSDSKLKTRIKHVGKSPSGINIYEFNYIVDGARRYRGVLGNELEKSHPEALGKKNGYMTVNYSKIDVNFEEVK